MWRKRFECNLPARNVWLVGTLKYKGGKAVWRQKMKPKSKRLPLHRLEDMLCHCIDWLMLYMCVHIPGHLECVWISLQFACLPGLKWNARRNADAPRNKFIVREFMRIGHKASNNIASPLLCGWLYDYDIDRYVSCARWYCFSQTTIVQTKEPWLFGPRSWKPTWNSDKRQHSEDQCLNKFMKDGNGLFWQDY